MEDKTELSAANDIDRDSEKLNGETSSTATPEENVQGGDFESAIRLGELYQIRWRDGCHYICEAKQIAEPVDENDEPHVYVHFMQQIGKNNVYIWPTKTADSWEPLSMFTEDPVHMEFVASK
ncbi:uncharacterized protein LOC143279994 [Babylonia areolata]|uniref:uncharacterized protein LOC143279994 n=1 Tax=Babylonia areolata TaxID=304850 RepID=UPI003FD15B54